MAEYPKWIGERGTPERRLVHTAEDEGRLMASKAPAKAESLIGATFPGPNGVMHTATGPEVTVTGQPPELTIHPPIKPVIVDEDIETPDPIAGEPFGEPKRGRGRPPKVRE